VEWRSTTHPFQAPQLDEGIQREPGSCISVDVVADAQGLLQQHLQLLRLHQLVAGGLQHVEVPEDSRQSIERSGKSEELQSSLTAGYRSDLANALLHIAQLLGGPLVLRHLSEVDVRGPGLQQAFDLFFGERNREIKRLQRQTKLLQW